MAVTIDFVMVRFATRPYSFLRQAHRSITPWLHLKKIQYTSYNDFVYFEMPDDLKIYQSITPEVCDIIRPFSSIVKRYLFTTSFMKMFKFKVPLSAKEAWLLADLGIPIIL